MAKSYDQLLQQIAALQAEADRVRRKEVDEVIARIRDAIKHYGITAAELGFSGAAKAGKPGRPKGTGAKPGRPKKAGKPVAAQYRDANGNTWSGRGKRPNWLRDALASGRTLEEFKVSAA